MFRYWINFKNVIVIEAGERAAAGDHRIAKAARAIIILRTESRSQSLAHAEMHRLPGDAFPGPDQARDDPRAAVRGGPWHRALPVARLGVDVEIDVPREIKDAFGRRGDARFNFDHSHITFVRIPRIFVERLTLDHGQLVLAHDAPHPLPGLHFIREHPHGRASHRRAKDHTDVVGMRMRMQRIDEKDHHLATIK